MIDSAVPGTKGRRSRLHASLPIKGRIAKNFLFLTDPEKNEETGGKRRS
jgi:hypothetical protein